MQNRALRWAYKIHWQDYATSESLHTFANIPSINTYHHHLAEKQINKLTDTLQQYVDIRNAMTPQNMQNVNLFHEDSQPLPDLIYTYR